MAPGGNLYVGVMSGTSADGIDVALVDLTDPYEPKLLSHTHEPYDESLTSRVLQVQAQQPVPLRELVQLDTDLGLAYAHAIKHALAKVNFPPKQLVAIGLHGQTIFHDDTLATWQLGNAALVAAETGYDTVADFRRADMAVGGKGAPLVPFADFYWFGHAERLRVVLNLGGIGNLTALFPDGQVRAFDTGPANMLIDLAARHFFEKPYDANGVLASKGTVHAELLATILGMKFFNKVPPRTTGRDDFGQPLFEQLLAQFPAIEPHDWMSTLTEATAESIAKACQRFVWPMGSPTPIEVILGGGGAANGFLVSRLEARLAQTAPKQLITPLKTHTDFDIPNQAKEAMAFALLAWAYINRVPANLATGAKTMAILGALYPTPKP